MEVNEVGRNYEEETGKVIKPPMKIDGDFEELQTTGGRFEDSEITLALQDSKGVLESIDSKLESYNDLQSDIRDIKEELRRK